MEFDIQYDCLVCEKNHIRRFKISSLFCLHLETLNHSCYMSYNIYYNSKGRNRFDIRCYRWNIGANASDIYIDLCNEPGMIYVRLVPEAIPALPPVLTDIVNKYV